MAEKKLTQMCTCENCGNEAEMVVTCQWVEEAAAQEENKTGSKPRKIKGTGTCTNCGNEAETWVDL